jgi:hypothetical protein
LYSVDHDAEATCPEIHYMLAADWGTLTLRAEGDKVRWYPVFYGVPDWDAIDTWLLEVEEGMSSAYGIEAPGLADRVARQIQANWKAV